MRTWGNKMPEFTSSEITNLFKGKDSMTRVFFALLLKENTKFGLYRDDVLAPTKDDMKNKGAWVEKQEKIKKLKEDRKKGKITGRKGWWKMRNKHIKRGRPREMPHNRNHQTYDYPIKKLLSNNLINDAGERIEDGRTHRYYKANLEVIKAFIRRYAFNRYEVQWAEKVLEGLLKKDSWKKAVDCVLIESRPLEFMPSLICFIFGGTRTMSKIGEYIPYFTHGRLDGEIDFVGVFLFQEEYFHVLGERFNWGQNLNASSEKFREKMQKQIKEEFQSRVLDRMEKDVLGEFFNPPITHFMSEDEKKKYLSLSKNEFLKETISFVKTVPDHFVREYLGENTWEKTLTGVYEDEVYIFSS
jgi:hypothetical protein